MTEHVRLQKKHILKVVYLHTRVRCYDLPSVYRSCSVISRQIIIIMNSIQQPHTQYRLHLYQTTAWHAGYYSNNDYITVLLIVYTTSPFLIIVQSVRRNDRSARSRVGLNCSSLRNWLSRVMLCLVRHSVGNDCGGPGQFEFVQCGTVELSMIQQFCQRLGGPMLSQIPQVLSARLGRCLTL